VLSLGSVKGIITCGGLALGVKKAPIKNVATRNPINPNTILNPFAKITPFKS